MTPEALALRESMVRAVSTAQSLKQQVDQLESSCQHDWPVAVYDPEYKDAYTIPGDAPGTMGVDRRGPSHVPAKTTKRWRRVCRQCGKIQTTERVRMGTETDGLAKEVPDFSYS